MSITPSVVQEIIAQCQKKGFVISPPLASFYAKTLCVSEEKDGTGAIEISRERVASVVEHAVRRLTQADSASLETFKLQAAVLSQHQEAVNQQRTELVQHRAKSQQLLHEVCQRSGGHAKVFGDIVLYILHETGLYNASNKELVQKETMTALESVIPRQSIESFVAQSDAEKTKQLDELWKIVWGIRLFNRETQKGGAGIQDMPGDLASMVQAAQTTLNQQLDQANKLCSNYFVTLEAKKAQGDSPEVQRLMEEYVNTRQYIQFLTKTADSVTSIARHMALVRPAYDSLILEIKSMVTSSTSVPKSSIYPKFIEVSDKWDAFKRLFTDMKGHKKVLDVLLDYRQSYNSTLKPAMVEEGLKAEAARPKTPIDQAALEREINGKNSGCFYSPALPSGILAQYNAFCVVSVLQDRMLRPALPEVGYLKYAEKYYGFASEKQLKAFAAGPKGFVDAMVRNQTIASDALIHLLDLGKELPTELYLLGTRQKVSGPVEVTMADADTQTGQIEPYKDYKYQWNEWELRRLALKLADLRNKRTHSCQTHQSHMKRDNDTQTYPKKQSGSQTMTDQSTQPKHTVQYIAGLRGDPTSRIKVVKAEFDE